jgi:hypothetical protein
MKRIDKNTMMIDLESKGPGLFRKTSSQQLVFTILPAITFLMAVVIVSIVFQIPLSNFTRDTSAIANINPVYGIVSNMGILLWCVAASTCAFAAMMHKTFKSKINFYFLLTSALLSSYLMFDDLFLIHEKFSVKAGLNEEVVFVFLGVAIVTYLIYFRKLILQTNAIMLLIALVFFALSILSDFSEQWLKMQLGHWKYLIEDGAKWIGIVFWCSYHLHTSYYFTKRSLRMTDI